jgi:hypothetical protein
MRKLRLGRTDNIIIIFKCNSSVIIILRTLLQGFIIFRFLLKSWMESNKPVLKVIVPYRIEYIAYKEEINCFFISTYDVRQIKIVHVLRQTIFLCYSFVQM